MTDSRDGNTYKTVVIGTQTWMAENLNYAASGSWCYDGTASNCAEYGVLYNWTAAQTACPSGWHLPSDEEWQTLEMYAGMSSREASSTGYRGTDQGTKLKATSGWYENSYTVYGTDDYGFSALPGADRTSDGSFNIVGYLGYWWTATEGRSTNAYSRLMDYSGANVGRYSNSKEYGFSVRCLKY